MRKRVLFICTHNSARSLMAEALLNHMGRGRFDAFSAGTHPASVRPEAVRALAEAGIPAEDLRSKPLNEFLGERFDLVVTLCDGAKGSCPFFPGAAEMVHAPFPDPATEDDFRKVRDGIIEWLRSRFGI